MAGQIAMERPLHTDNLFRYMTDFSKNPKKSFLRYFDIIVIAWLFCNGLERTPLQKLLE